ncbi:DUF159-domain-containing protein [Rozella allomycis CSF55]|uniref:DUF159-domain-containing protein n=1 Tax=Rozella allomycis (strain CSF55) TaxID=988480 RepID=A0A4P9YM18_ROZAC|nr:DUF159-domain-containing protein [Rozella allomycis CSF55]
MINVRSDSLIGPYAKTMYKNIKYTNRGIAIAQGFFEWREHNGKKIPYYITPKSDPVFFFAAIYDSNKNLGVDSYTIVTTSSKGSQMEKLHDRIPVILKENEIDVWLGKGWNSELENIIEDRSRIDLQYHKVAPLVNKVGTDGPELIQEVKEKIPSDFFKRKAKERKDDSSKKIKKDTEVINLAECTDLTNDEERY